MKNIRIRLWERAMNGQYFVRDFIDFAILKPLSYDEGLILGDKFAIMPPKNGRLSIEVID